MRDIIVSLVIFGLMPACYRKPFVGLVVFSWLAYMRVQDLAWGFARGMRWSYYVALITFAGFLKDKRGKPWFYPDMRCYVMIALVIIVFIGVAVSGAGPNQMRKFMEFGKIVAIALFTTTVVTNKERLRVLLWVISLSLGFYGIKSGIWGILGGQQILRGPGGMLADNNDFSLALGMAVPMLLHLGFVEKRRVIKRTFFFAVPLTIITVGLTHSRGGFLALAAGIMVLVWRSRNRVMGLVAGLFLAVAAFIAAPESYKERIYSITEYETEGSAQGRLRAWGIAVNMAMGNPVLGVGLGYFQKEYLNYAENPTPGERDRSDIIVAHNSYLQIWSECGTPALLLYLTLIGASFYTIWRIRRKARTRYYSSWMLNYCTMFEASLVTFMVGATFLNRAHFDLFYHWVALIMVFGHIADREMANVELHPVREGGRAPVHAVRAPGFGPRPAYNAFTRTFTGRGA